MAFAKTRELLATDQPIFKAGFCENGALAFADVMLPVEMAAGWRMAEVKSSSEVKSSAFGDFGSVASRQWTGFAMTAASLPT